MYAYACTHRHTQQRKRERERERATELFFWDPESFNDSKLCCDGVRQRGSLFRGHTQTHTSVQTGMHAHTLPQETTHTFTDKMSKYILSPSSAEALTC